jgi:hypothetical protein
MIAQFIGNSVVSLGQLGLQIVHNVRVIARHERRGQTRFTCTTCTTDTMRVRCYKLY